MPPPCGLIAAKENVMKLVRKPRDIYYGTVRPTSKPKPAWMNDNRLLPRTPVPFNFEN